MRVRTRPSELSCCNCRTFRQKSRYQFPALQTVKGLTTGGADRSAYLRAGQLRGADDMVQQAWVQALQDQAVVPRKREAAQKPHDVAPRPARRCRPGLQVPQRPRLLRRQCKQICYSSWCELCKMYLGGHHDSQDNPPKKLKSWNSDREPGGVLQTGMRSLHRSRVLPRDRGRLRAPFGRHSRSGV